MKKTSVILVVLLIALIIVGAVGMVPFALFCTAIQNIGDAVVEPSSTYQISYKNLVNNTSLSDNVKAEVINMYNTTDELVNVATFGMFWIFAVLVLVISVILIVIGIYFIKNENCKNYIGTALIVAACILLAFTAILTFFVIA